MFGITKGKILYTGLVDCPLMRFFELQADNIQQLADLDNNASCSKCSKANDKVIVYLKELEAKELNQFYLVKCYPQSSCKTSK
jgi:hypothetical protein